MNLFRSRFVKMPSHVIEQPGSLTAPLGYAASGVSCGLKNSGRLDLGLLVSRASCASAELYTTNAAAAAPIRYSREKTAAGRVRGVVANSGSANACTGGRGFAAAEQMAVQAAELCGIEPDGMAVASTGVIGGQLETDLVSAGIDAAAASLSASGGGAFAEAIKTTDRIDKEGAVSVMLAAGEVRIGACAKGAGMIAPSMATMLAFVTTDAGASPELLKGMLKQAAASSFNLVSVDGDMSTNDCVFLLANGASGVELHPGSPDAGLFADAVQAVCKSLALKMVADGEGATKVVELKVTGAASPEEADRVARSVAGSTLVRTAFYGSNANWGRIMGSLGAALAGGPALAADIFYEDVCLAQAGEAVEVAGGGRLAWIMSQPEISVGVDLHRGASAQTVYFSDLTHDYVTLNAEYTT